MRLYITKVRAYAGAFWIMYVCFVAFWFLLSVQYVHYKIKVKFILEQATKAQSGSRCVALLFL
jgi:hypothetical protein